jgi:hypothetical protein
MTLLLREGLVKIEIPKGDKHPQFKQLPELRNPCAAVRKETRHEDKNHDADSMLSAVDSAHYAT